MDAGALRDREIVSVEQATRLGKVSDILFDTQPLRVAALKASGDEGEFVVAIDRVSRFGPDAVMVESSGVRELARSTRGSERTLDELTHLKVVDEDGKSLGTVRSIDFDPESGTVERIVAGESGTFGLGGMTATIRARAIRGVGTDLLTVASSGEADESSNRDREVPASDSRGGHDQRPHAGAHDRGGAE